MRDRGGEEGFRKARKEGSPSVRKRDDFVRRFCIVNPRAMQRMGERKSERRNVKLCWLRHRLRDPILTVNGKVDSR